MNSDDLNIAIVGATGAAGGTAIDLLLERKHPAGKITVMASERSAGRKIPYGDAELTVIKATADAFDGIDVALFAAGGLVSRRLARKAVERGVFVIDKGSIFRMDPSIPLVVPEVNGDDIDWHPGIVSTPNCTTTPLVMALKPLHDLSPIKRVVVATYQSTSGGGKAPMDELFNQTRGIFTNQPVQKSQKNFTKQIAFNVIPHIDVFMDDGSTKEEWKMMVETKKILDPKIKLNATCVRVPVFVGHSEAVNIEFENELSAEQAQEILREAPGIMLIDKREDEGYVTPVESAGDSATYISRVRDDPTVDNGITLWCVSDNLRKGAALNAVQIAELLGRECLKKG